MTTSADINPNFITSSPVQKAGLRTQLQYIKEAIAAVEQYRGWKLLSYNYLSSAAADLRVPLTAGYIRYRVEFEALKKVGANVPVYVRGSTDGGTSYVSTATYITQGADFSGAGTTNINTTDTGWLLSGNQNNGALGIFGQMEFESTRASALLDCVWIDTVPTRYRRTAVVTQGAGFNYLQFFPQGGGTLPTGSMVSVMVRDDS